MPGSQRKKEKGTYKGEGKDGVVEDVTLILSQPLATAGACLRAYAGPMDGFSFSFLSLFSFQWPNKALRVISFVATGKRKEEERKDIDTVSPLRSLR